MSGDRRTDKLSPGATTSIANSDETGSIDSLIREAGRISAPSVSDALRLPIGTCLAQGRLHVLRQLGAGGMGDVYEVFDDERRGRVALKVLRGRDAVDIYRLKNEFRSLTQIIHPNVVRLYELFAEDGLWFFTMELLEGEPFSRWVRPLGMLDGTRLRAALAQLVAGVDTIHRAGKLHRDLKPSNVLVTKDGRVSIIDLGMAIDPAHGGIGHTLTEHSISGTPAYMSPEQAAGTTLSAASDYYAIGVMLYEALTGELPFEGGVGAILAAKQYEVPPQLASRVAPNLVPLASLADALLQTAAEARPGPAQIAAATLSTAPRAHDSACRTSSLRDGMLLVGREAEIQVLTKALEETVAGKSVVVAVQGESGVGKSALCSSFLEIAEAKFGAVVLSARCFEQESVPFKAIDPLMDALTRYMRKLPEAEAAALLPRDAFALRRLIPTFGRLEVLSRVPSRDVNDPEELQQRAFEALSELLARMRDRGPVVAHIDDLQWGDADSINCLRHLIGQGRSAPVLFLLSFRSIASTEEVTRLAPLLAEGRDTAGYGIRTLLLGNLSQADATVLAERLLPSGADVAGQIAREAGGSPFILRELCLSVDDHPDRHHTLTVSRMVGARAAGLTPTARTLLEIVALAGRPLAVPVALTAADAGYTEVDALEEARLLRFALDHLGEVRQIECYHDRIRESITASLPVAHRASLWRRLANALLDVGDDRDAELLCRCLEESGDAPGAAKQAARAATQAFDQLAFERAAALYARVLELGTESRDEELAVTRALATALTSAGRGHDAAERYLTAARLTSGDEALEFEQLAAQQLLIAGDVEEGRALLSKVRTAIGLNSPADEANAMTWLAAQLERLRSGEVKWQSSAHLDKRMRLKLSTAQTTLMNILHHQLPRAAEHAAQYLEMALDAGHAWHLIAALGTTARMNRTVPLSDADVELLLHRMDQLVEAASDAGHAAAYASETHGIVLFNRCEFRKARQRFAHVQEHDLEHRALRGDVSAYYAQKCAYYCGDYADIVRTTPLQIEDARRRGRWWTAALLSGFTGAMAYLTPDCPSDYRRQLEVARSELPIRGAWSLPHFGMFFGEIVLDQYVGEPERALELLQDHRTMIAREGVFARVMCAVYLGSTAVASLARNPGSPSRQTLLETSRSAAAELRAFGTWGLQGNADVIEATLALLDGDRDLAVARLKRALRVFEEWDMGMVAAAVRRRLGQLLGEADGRAFVRAAEAFMLAQGVQNIEAMSQVYCHPGGLR